MAVSITFKQSNKDCYAYEFIEVASSTYGIFKDGSSNHYIRCSTLDETTMDKSTSTDAFIFMSDGSFKCWGSLIETS